MRGDEKKHFKRSFNSYVEIIPAFLSSTEEMWINEVCQVGAVKVGCATNSQKFTSNSN